jgi:sn1-specific diacylglycerol lipase
MGTDSDATNQFLAMRKTLEANMHLAELFPPGRVWWALRDDALHPSNRRTGAPAVRLFEVHDVEKVFGQVVLAGDMLRLVVVVHPSRLCADYPRSSHLPHRYDAVISELS